MTVDWMRNRSDVPFRVVESPENSTVRKQCPYAHFDTDEKANAANRPRKVVKPWYARLFAGCTFQSRSQRKLLGVALKEDKAFWATVYRAYDALCTPVILGEIEMETLDVKIVYANAAACDLTGYDAGEKSWTNPNGMIGRSITELMEDSLSNAHAGFVEGWLYRRGMLKTSSSISIHISSSAETDRSRHSTAHVRMKKVEGISRRLTIVTSDGRLLSVDAALSFFTARGLGKVVGIFSFKSAEKHEVVSFRGISFNLKYRPDNSTNACYVVVVNPPAKVSEFSSDDKWQITSVTEGFVLSETDRLAIKELVREQIFYHLSKICYASKLDVTYIDSYLHALSASKFRNARVNLVDSINSSKSEKNMHLAASRAQGGDRIRPFRSYDVRDAEDTEMDLEFSRDLDEL